MKVESIEPHRETRRIWKAAEDVMKIKDIMSAPAVVVSSKSAGDAMKRFSADVWLPSWATTRTLRLLRAHGFEAGARRNARTAMVEIGNLRKVRAEAYAALSRTAADERDPDGTYGPGSRARASRR